MDHLGNKLDEKLRTKFKYFWDTLCHSDESKLFEMFGGLNKRYYSFSLSRKQQITVRNHGHFRYDVMKFVETIESLRKHSFIKVHPAAEGSPLKEQLNYNLEIVYNVLALGADTKYS